MTLPITITPQPSPQPSDSNFVRIVFDYECPDWNFTSRTNRESNPGGPALGQAPAVYGYSPTPQDKPNDFHVYEEPLKFFYFSLNNFDVYGEYDGLGKYRCESFLFKDNTALYNKEGFPKRELLTMSGNKLEVIEWVTENGQRYCKFRTLTPSSNVNEMTFRSHPHFVHIFNIVQLRDERTITNPKVSRGGFLYYYLTSKDGFAFVPERFVKPL